MGDMAPTAEEKEAMKQRRDERYQRNVAWLDKVVGYVVIKKTPYQFRFFGEGVGEFLDMYPTNQRYHNLITGERGRYKTAQGFIDLQYKKTKELKENASNK